MSCLVHGDSSGPPCRRYGGGRWGTLWEPLTPGHARKKPQPPSQPRRASGSCGLSCPVLSVWPWRACRSCFVLSCCVFSPRGLLIPPNFPREIFFGGYKSSGCRGRAERTEAKAPEDHLPWPPELPTPPWPPELPAPPWPPNCLFRSGGPHPVFLSVSVLRGLQSAHPPSPMELLRLGSSLSGGGSYVSPLSCVCHVFPPLVSIFGLFPVLVKCHYELILVQPCLSNYLWFTCVFIVLSVQFDFVWSTRYFPGVSCPCKSCLVLPCPPLMSTLKTIIWVYVLVCVFLFLPAVCTVTSAANMQVICMIISNWLIMRIGP